MTEVRHGTARSVFLIGPMGAGKTTVGRKLADLLGYGFHDSDHEIEARTGVDIPFIFEKEGEAGFRQREAAVIAELSAQPHVVLATGGGAVLREETRERLHARGTVVYLHASLEQQVHRTERCEHRPLLAAGNRRETLVRLFAEREPLYRSAAHLVLATEGKNARQLAREICEHLKRQDDAPAHACGSEATEPCEDAVAGGSPEAVAPAVDGAATETAADADADPAMPTAVYGADAATMATAPASSAP